MNAARYPASISKLAIEGAAMGAPVMIQTSASMLTAAVHIHTVMTSNCHDRKIFLFRRLLRWIVAARDPTNPTKTESHTANCDRLTVAGARRTHKLYSMIAPRIKRGQLESILLRNA